MTDQITPKKPRRTKAQVLADKLAAQEAAAAVQRAADKAAAALAKPKKPRKPKVVAPVVAVAEPITIHPAMSAPIQSPDCCGKCTGNCEPIAVPKQKWWNKVANWFKS